MLKVEKKIEVLLGCSDIYICVSLDFSLIFGYLGWENEYKSDFVSYRRKTCNLTRNNVFDPEQTKSCSIFKVLLACQKAHNTAYKTKTDQHEPHLKLEVILGDPELSDTE